MGKISIEADELKRLRLTLAIARKAQVWGVRDYAVEDVVARAMESAQIDATSGELRNFDADVFLSGIAVDEKTRHLVNMEIAKEKKRSNPAFGDLTEKEFLALPPEERLRRHNLANPLGTEKRD